MLNQDQQKIVDCVTGGLLVMAPVVIGTDKVGANFIAYKQTPD